MGGVEVITGSMFSGKTEELIRRLKRAQIAQQSVQAFKPRIDSRYDKHQLVSHSSQRLVSIPVDGPDDILRRLAADTQVVGIDEVQFLGPNVVALCELLANRGLRVICAGLDQDFRGRPFEPMPQLLAVAEFITKEHAICVVCGNIANRSQRIVDGTSTVVVGGFGTYEPRCRRCFEPGPEEEAESPQAELFT